MTRRDDLKMKTLITYFSGSGNTRYGVELIKKGLEKKGSSRCDLIQVRDFNNDMIKDYDLIGYAAPIYGYKPSINMLELIDELQKEHAKPCFTFITSAGVPANSNRIIFDSLKKKGWDIIGQSQMICEDSWTMIRKKGKIYKIELPSKEEQYLVYEFGTELQRLFNDYHLFKKISTRPKFKLCWQHIVSKTFLKLFLSLFFVIRIDTSKCTKCGLCINNCPTGRMNSETFPELKGDCIGCNGCINICPNDAVIGMGTQGKYKYKGIPQEKKL